MLLVLSFGANVAHGIVRLSAQPAQLQFGNGSIGSRIDLSCRITSTAATDLQIDTMYIDGTNPADFVIVSPTQRSFILGPGDFRDMVIGFRPTKTGTRTAILRILTSDGELDIPLSGSGANTQPNVEIIPATLDFGPLLPGAIKDSTIYLVARGPDSATISDLGVLNQNAGSYFTARFANTVLQLPVKLGPGDSLAIIAEFAAASPLGPKTGSVTADGEVLGNTTCLFNGDVVEPDLLLSPSTIDYGIVTRGAIIDTTVTIYSTGVVPLEIDDIEPLTNGWSFLTPFPVIPVTIKPNATLTLHIRFNPTDTGLISYNLGMLAHETSSGGNFRSVHLTAIVRDIPLAVSGKDLSYFCALDSTISGSLDATNQGKLPLDITSYSTSDSLVSIDTVFPVSIAASQVSHFVLHHKPGYDTNASVTITLKNGNIAFQKVVVLLHSQQLFGIASSSILVRDTIALTEQRHVVVLLDLTKPQVRHLVVSIAVSNSDIATIDPQSISLNLPILPGAQITGILPIVGGYEVSIALPNGVQLGAIPLDSAWLVRYELHSFLASQAQSQVITSVRVPELVGCLSIASDTSGVSLQSRCGDDLLRKKLTDSPLLDEVHLSENPVTGSNATLNFQLSTNALVKYDLYSSAGICKVTSAEMGAPRGYSNLSLNLGALASGNYFVHFTAKTPRGEIASRTISFIKLR